MKIKNRSFGFLNINEQNKYLISCSVDMSIKMWCLRTNTCMRTLNGHTDEVWCIKLLQNSMLISGSHDKCVKIWDLETGTCVRTLTGHKNGINCLKVLADNKIASGSERTIKIWDTRSADCIMNLNQHTDWLSCLEKLPNDNLVSCSHDNTIKVWDVNRGGVCVKTLKDVSDIGLNCLRLLNNGYMACGSLNKIINILNIETGKCVQVLKGHAAEIWDLQLTASGKNNEIVSCSEDRKIKVWNSDTGECMRTLAVTLI